jgi:hypothetical protein
MSNDIELLSDTDLDIVAGGDGDFDPYSDEFPAFEGEPFGDEN